VHLRGIPALALLLCLGCFEAHYGSGPGSPGGSMDGGAYDAGCFTNCRTIFDVGMWTDDFEPPPYTDLRGIPSEEAIAQCGAVDGFLRCDTCGEEMCPDWTLCRDYMGVCVGRYHTPGGGCSFTLLPGMWGEYYHLRPLPCAVEASAMGTREARFEGIEMPVSYCLAVRDLADLPPHKCVYPDGTEVVTGPPDEPCPGPEGSMIVCGGSCGEFICPGAPATACIGFSDSRAFGICAFLKRRCAPSNSAELITECETHPATWFPGACACMLVDPQASLPDVGRTGHVVPAEACKRYQSFYPDQVECRDGTWNLL
jgi:hypothetical protein